jgi:WD40 repeat protein
VSQGCLIKLWDAHSHPEARLLCHDERWSRSLRTAWSPDSQQVFVAGIGWNVSSPQLGSRSVRGGASFEPETGLELFRLPADDHYSAFSSCIDSAFSPHVDRLAILAIGGQGKDNEDEYFVRIYDSKTHEMLSSFRRVPPGGGFTRDVPSIAYADYGRVVLEFVDQRRFLYVEVCDATTGKTAFVVDGIRCHPAVSCDGRRLATFHDFGQVRLWDTATGRRLAEIGGDGKGGRQSIAINSDGRRVAVARAEGLAVYDVDSGEGREVFRSSVGCEVAAFTPDGRSLATGGPAGVISIWHPASGQQVLTLHGHSAAIRGLSFSPNGRFLASVGGDGSVKLWEAAARE